MKASPPVRRLPPLVTLLVAVVATSVTLALWWHERENEQARLRVAFDNAVRQTAQHVQQRLASYEQMLRGLQGLFAASGGQVASAEFERYVDAVMQGPDALGLQRFAYNAAVPQARLDAFVAARRADGERGFAVQPPTTRALHAPLTYIAPAGGGNVRVLGFDTLTEPTREVAMDQARDAGTLALTPRLTLRVDQGAGLREVPGFIMYLPVYGPGPEPVTVAERRARLAGWVSAGFRVADMMSSLYGEQTPGLEVRLHDGTRTGNDTLMYRSVANDGAAASAEARHALLAFDAQEYIAVAGHTWTLRVRALPAFVERHEGRTSGVVLPAGAVLSALLALLTHQLVTQRRRAHGVAQAMTRELRASEARYRRIIETASEGLWIVDGGQRIVFANPQIARWLDVPEAAMIGRPFDDFMDAGDAARCRAAFAGRDAGPGGQPGVLEVALRGRDGGVTWASLSFRGIIEDDGRPGGTLCMLTDVSARRDAEARRAGLEARLRESQKMEAIGTLAGGIAHDFNNILAAILGNVATARHALGQGADPEPALAQVHRAAVRARALVQQVLTFSRMQSPVLQPVSLQAVVDEALQILRATLPPTVRLDVRLPRRPVVVQGDATQLQQVVMNLCANAWHALPHGDGRIEVGVEAPEASEAAAAPAAPGALHRGASEAHLWVADDGEGMIPAVQARMYEPFFTTKPVGQGTGLGLAVVHGIVRGHGGRIEVDSAPGRGTRFDLWLPTAQGTDAADVAEAGDPGDTSPAAAPAVAEALPPPAPAARGEHLMCVDDDPAMLLMEQALLERCGYRVTTFERPADALRALREQPGAFDLLVTDYTMPEMDGLAFARRVAEAAPGLPVLVSSGFIADELREAASAQGVRALLQKEYTLERLPGLVRDVLAGHGRP